MIFKFSQISEYLDLDPFDVGILFVPNWLLKKYPSAENIKKLFPEVFIHQYITEEILDNIIMRHSILAEKKISKSLLVIFYYKQSIRVPKDVWDEFVKNVLHYDIILVELNKADSYNISSKQLFCEEFWKFDSVHSIKFLSQ